ncbi:MAG: hypothetical protein CL840_11725 [Crocinitomicaceae bacterium]|nr:hypothetical protein [Crocinitomicaceae bacterium]|tara:strand:+ start:269 stop:1042 length:774 start_codon:yes stop_codon:yes gene_type:complete
MSIKLTAIIIDDEPRARENLNTLLTDYCDVEVLAEASSVTEAMEQLAIYNPNVLFLDIQMPSMNGIELAEKIRHRNIPIVFVTAFDHYAIQAFKASAIDYLLKPTAIDDLQQTVKKIVARKRDADLMNSLISDSLQTLRSNLNKSQKLKNLMVPWENGFKVIDLSNLTRIISDSSYSELILTTGRMVVTKAIGEMESLLNDSNFFRIHNRHIVNMEFIDSFSTEDGGMVIMKDGNAIPVSRRRLPSFKIAAKQHFRN